MFLLCLDIPSQDPGSQGRGYGASQQHRKINSWQTRKETENLQKANALPGHAADLPMLFPLNPPSHPPSGVHTVTRLLLRTEWKGNGLSMTE